MAHVESEIRVEREDGRTRPGAPTENELSLGELFKQLTRDTSHLIRQEVNLAKAEMRETSAALARDGMKIGIALVLALVGALAATAFLILALGSLLGNYWLAALIVAVLFLGIGALMGKGAVNRIKQRGLKPEETIETLQEDAAWARREAQELKRELTS